jgi:hypothetical protein
VHHSHQLSSAYGPSALLTPTAYAISADGAEKPQVSWFWNHVEQCSQSEKAEVSRNYHYVHSVYMPRVISCNRLAAVVVVDGDALPSPKQRCQRPQFTAPHSFRV